MANQVFSTLLLFTVVSLLSHQLPHAAGSTVSTGLLPGQGGGMSVGDPTQAMMQRLIEMLAKSRGHPDMVFFGYALPRDGPDAGNAAMNVVHKHHHQHQSLQERLEAEGVLFHQKSSGKSGKQMGIFGF